MNDAAVSRKGTAAFFLDKNLFSVYHKDSLTKGRYPLMFSPDKYHTLLSTQLIGRTFLHFPTIDSTNLYAKTTAALSNGMIIAASHQTSGVGRLARRFHSPEGMGMYLSIVLYPDPAILSELSTITLMTAVAMVDTIEELTGVRPDIKWTNDIYLHGRKLCGILTESVIDPTQQKIKVIVGIGLNLLQMIEDFDPEIREIAGSLYSETGVKVDPERYIAVLAKHFERYYLKERFPENKEAFLDKYRHALFFLGQPVQVISARESYIARAIDIDENGCLIVERENGVREALNSGEISLKIPR